MRDENDSRINAVCELSSNDSHKVDNIRAKFVLKNTINENENPDFIIRQNAQNLLMMNKKTEYGFLYILIDENIFK